MKTVNKFKYIFFLIVIVMSICTGCSFGFLSRREVKQHVKQDLGIKNYSIAWTRGGGEHLGSWRVYDKDEDVHFEVFDVTSSGGDYIITISHYISDNYIQKLAERRAEDLPENIEYVSPVKENDYSEVGSFIIHYSDLNNLKASCEVFWDYAAYIRSKDEVPLYFQTVPDAGNDRSESGIDYRVGSYSGHIGQDGHNDKRYEATPEEFMEHARNQYLAYGLIYQDVAVLSEMSQEDIQQVIAENEINQVFIVEDLDRAMTADAEEHRHIALADGEISHRSKTCLAYCPDINTFRITFGGLYALLREEGQAVEGDAAHFTYKSKDGDLYEFSYEFADHYLKNNEKIGTDKTYCLNHQMIFDITGLYVDFVHYPFLSADSHQVY